MLHGRDPNILINQFLEATPHPIRSGSYYIGTLMNRLHYSFHRVRQDAAVARQRQREQYNKRLKEHKFKIDDRVLLNIKVVKDGESKKFTYKYEGPFRIVKIYIDKTALIVDSSYTSQHVHINRLKPLFETMLWRDEACPIISMHDLISRFRKAVCTQTDANASIPIEETTYDSDPSLEYLPPLSPVLSESSNFETQNPPLEQDDPLIEDPFYGFTTPSLDDPTDRSYTLPDTLPRDIQPVRSDTTPDFVDHTLFPTPIVQPDLQLNRQLTHNKSQSPQEPKGNLRQQRIRKQPGYLGDYILD